jgi:hypothetical protein
MKSPAKSYLKVSSNLLESPCLMPVVERRLEAGAKVRKNRGECQYICGSGPQTSSNTTIVLQQHHIQNGGSAHLRPRIYELRIPARRDPTGTHLPA